MQKTIKEWLLKPSGRYFDGLAIFSQLASADIKKKYEAYFREVKSEPKSVDIHFTMLVNKVAQIDQKFTANPSAFEGLTLLLKESAPDAATLEAIEAKNEEIVALKAKIEALKTDNEDVLDENSELNDQVEDLENDLESAKEDVSVYEQQLLELETEMEALKEKRGVQIVAFNDLPEELQKLYNRNKEITPIMASIHADISVENLHFATRKKLVKQLCALDEERRANWDKIDDWSEGKTVEFEVEKSPYSDDLVIAGAQMIRRSINLQENIKNTKATYESADREVIKENALKRLTAYETELAEILLKINPPKTDDPIVE